MSKCTENVVGVGWDHQGMPFLWHIINVFGLILKIYSLKTYTIILCISLKKPVCFVWYRNRGQMGICGLCFILMSYVMESMVLSLFPCVQTMLFSWLFRMRHKKLRFLHYITCVAVFLPTGVLNSACLTSLGWRSLPPKVRCTRSCDMEPGDGWNSQADLWIKKCNSERLPQKPIS